jgi:competence protein ComEC
MNVGILALVVFWLLRRLRLSEWLASSVTVGLASGYAFLCNGGAPIVRATLMLGLFLFARLLYRNRSPLNAMGVAATVVLLADPASLFDTSFILTFLCVLVIAGLGVPLLERTSDPYRRGLRHFQSTMFDLALPPRVVQFRLDLRMIIGRLGRLGPEPLLRFVVLKTIGLALAALLISALMQIALVLPMAAYFHRATLTALPANILVVPLTEILMPASLTALGLSYLSRTASAFPRSLRDGHWTRSPARCELRGQCVLRICICQLRRSPSAHSRLARLLSLYGQLGARAISLRRHWSC